MHYYIHRDGPGEIEKNTQTWANMTTAEKDDIYKEFVEVNTFFLFHMILFLFKICLTI